MRNLTAIDAHESRARGRGPDAAGGIGEDVPHLQVRESVLRIEDLEAALAHRDQAAAGRADPERSVAVEGERAQALARQAVCFAVELRSALLPAHEAVLGRRPHRAVLRLREGPDTAALHQVIAEGALEASVAIARGTLAVADPQRSPRRPP